jgi:glycerophosphoryl diester phosphodiesterase
MEIISHRGYWHDAAEKNSSAAFKRSFSLGYGTETDVRDALGTLVISHDPPQGGELSLADLLTLAGPEQPLLAINIKADGLAQAVAAEMKLHGYINWFVFDMSIPDTRAQLAASNPTYVRMSELEQAPPFLAAAAGVWLDAFESDSWRIGALDTLLRQRLKVCVVSPELHRRAHLPFWRELKDSGLDRDDNACLCTDLPEEASAFFAR